MNIKHALKTSSLCTATLLVSVAVQAQLVAPIRLPAMSFSVFPVITLPSPTRALPILPRPDVPVLPVPSLPGLPMYRYAVPVPVAAQPAVAFAAARPAVARIADERSAELRPGAPAKTLQNARRAFGLQGKKVTPRRLQSLFDGAVASDDDGAIVIVEEIERPQTLPEVDLLREIGATSGR